ncbi:MAG TPA: DUF4349 domain-containing protein [Methanospirillum sp.]|uniref:DUF4349 domain-containing protein n=1 Tax=Methanospirillum sp. TaxID=45200 RepID=UPI002C154C66|nr:DUF4349 domain-containing protein [Methanospirillum sp.]HOJ95287.1 DUF4349 domain-containing protein [Methanospirillum sp.]HOL41208.1 DUF4349 domain-containing protein [Methanospirillum sp.]
MKNLSVLVLLLLIGMMVTAGCTGFEKTQPMSISEESFSRSKGTYETDGYAYAPAPMAKATSAAGYEPSSATGSSIPEQKIIRTAEIRIEVRNVSVSAEQVQEVAKRYEGLIQSSSVSAGSQNRYSGTVTIRIPAQYFDQALADIMSLGKVLSSSINADDVTEEYVDLVAQRDSLTNQLTQYNRLLEKGSNVSEILEVQKEIERVQVQLDRIVGRMKYLDNRIALSTITVSLSEPAQVETPGGYSLPGVISDGIAGFVYTVVWLFVAILTLLPLILLGGAGYFVYQRWKKNKAE